MASWIKNGFIFFTIVIAAACSVDPKLVVAVEETASLQPTSEGALTQTPLSHPHLDSPDFRQGLIPEEQGWVDRLPDASIYQIELELFPNDSVVIGRQKVIYTNQEDQLLSEIYFHLFPNILGGSMSVSKVRVNDLPCDVSQVMADSALRIVLPVSLQPGQKITIAMDFRVLVPRQMESGYGLLNDTDGVMALDSVYPSIAVYDEMGWHKNPPSPNSDLTYADVSFYQVRVTSPKDLVVAASGVEVEKEIHGDKQTQNYIGGPMRDFYLAASEDFVIISQQSGSTRVSSYAKKGMEEAASQALTTSLDALQSYKDRFGIYPYRELDLVSTPMQSLGIEYPGIVGLSLALYDPGGTITGLPAPILLDSVTAHEVAHQWFYNIIGNDQIEEPWLDEALAQYATGLYYLDVYGEESARSYKESWMQRWARVDRAHIPIGLPARDYTAEEYGAIIYGRGPLFLDSLAQTMGNETFDAFLKRYTAEYQWGTANTRDFKNLAEETCNCDLGSIFKQWVY